MFDNDNDIRLRISQEQRIKMIMSGLSPLNEQHVRDFLSGNKGNFNDKLEYAKTLIGEDAFNNSNLGHGSHKENEGPNPTNNDIKNIKKQLEEDLDSYGNNMDVDFSSKLQMNLLNSNHKPTVKKIQNTINYEELGYKNTINYLNNFIFSLKNPSTSNRIKVQKSITNTLKVEQELKNNPNVLKAYQLGCIKAEKTMYNKLTK